MRRRSLLRAASAALPLALAGCTGVENQTGGARAPRASLRMESVSDADIAREVLWPVENDNGERATLLEQVSDGEIAERQGFEPLLRDGQRVVREGEVYRVATTETASTPVTVYSITLSDLAYDTVTEAPDDGRVKFGDLPPVGRGVRRVGPGGVRVRAVGPLGGRTGGPRRGHRRRRRLHRPARRDRDRGRHDAGRAVPTAGESAGCQRARRE